MLRGSEPRHRHIERGARLKRVITETRGCADGMRASLEVVCPTVARGLSTIL
jgi:hypothetical protein